MNLASVFGLKARLRRLRILAGEGALALEDRVRLLKFALDEERQRLRTTVVLIVAVIGLTTVAVPLLSVAIVVHFWDTPQRALVAWLLAALWVGLWIVALAMLAASLRRASDAFEPARDAFQQDLAWFHATFGAESELEEIRRERPPVTRAELLARIERQRQRVATLQAAASGAGEAPGQKSETASAAALRIAREHPVATGMAGAAVLAVLGPKRVLRWAATIAPVLWRMR
ncbi:MAG TPA: phage holin family protein [Variovorax sp.]|jgi:uncharacterized membrane protein YqjE